MKRYRLPAAEILLDMLLGDRIKPGQELSARSGQFLVAEPAILLIQPARLDGPDLRIQVPRSRHARSTLNGATGTSIGWCGRRCGTGGGGDGGRGVLPRWSRILQDATGTRRLADHIAERNIAASSISPQQASRERWALGDHRDRPPWSSDLPWQWLELAGTESAGADEAEFGRVMLGRTAGGQVTDAGIAGHGFLVGAAAFESLAEWIDAGLSDPDTYLCNNDLWVAARNREMAAVSLRHAQRAAMSDGLAELADWVDSQLVPGWQVLVRTMHYNAMRVARGRRPNPSVPTELRTIAELDGYHSTAAVAE